MSLVETNLSAAKNRIGKIGFVMALVVMCGVAITGPFGDATTLVGIVLTSLSLPGMWLSAFGLRRPPRRLAAWGLVIALVAAMYLPTFCLPLLRG